MLDDVSRLFPYEKSEVSIFLFFFVLLKEKEGSNKKYVEIMKILFSI